MMTNLAQMVFWKSLRRKGTRLNRHGPTVLVLIAVPLAMLDLTRHVLQDGGVWTIETSGLDATEIVSYDAYGLTGEPSGMDMWIYTGQIFWTDLTAGAVYSALFDGSGLALVSDNFTKPFDLSIAPHQGKLYVSDWELERLIRLNTEGGEWEEFLHVPTPRGVWCDQTSDRVFFASYNLSYIGAASMDQHIEGRASNVEIKRNVTSSKIQNTESWADDIVSNDRNIEVIIDDGPVGGQG